MGLFQRYKTVEILLNEPPEMVISFLSFHSGVNTSFNRCSEINESKPKSAIAVMTFYAKIIKMDLFDEFVAFYFCRR